MNVSTQFFYVHSKLKKVQNLTLKATKLSVLLNNRMEHEICFFNSTVKTKAQEKEIEWTKDTDLKSAKVNQHLPNFHTVIIEDRSRTPNSQTKQSESSELHGNWSSSGSIWRSSPLLISERIAIWPPDNWGCAAVVLGGEKGKGGDLGFSNFWKMGICSCSMWRKNKSIK